MVETILPIYQQRFGYVDSRCHSLLTALLHIFSTLWSVVNFVFSFTYSNKNGDGVDYVSCAPTALSLYRKCCCTRCRLIFCCQERAAKKAVKIIDPGVSLSAIDNERDSERIHTGLSMIGNEHQMEQVRIIM
jgi:hypothetical protein